MEMRDILIAAYLAYINSCVSYEGYAAKNGLTPKQAKVFILIAKSVFKTEHPDK